MLGDLDEGVVWFRRGPDWAMLVQSQALLIVRPFANRQIPPLQKNGLRVMRFCRSMYVCTTRYCTLGLCILSINFKPSSNHMQILFSCAF